MENIVWVEECHVTDTKGVIALMVYIRHKMVERFTNQLVRTAQ